MKFLHLIIFLLFFHTTLFSSTFLVIPSFTNQSGGLRVKISDYLITQNYQITETYAFSYYINGNYLASLRNEFKADQTAYSIRFTGLQLGQYYYPEPLVSETLNYTYSQLSITGSFLQLVGRNYWFGFGGGIRQFDRISLDDPDSFPPLEYGHEGGTDYELSSYFIIDTRDRILQPLNGYYIRTNLQSHVFNLYGSNIWYGGIVDGFYYSQSLPDTRLMVRLFTHHVTDKAPYYLLPSNDGGLMMKGMIRHRFRGRHFYSGLIDFERHNIWEQFGLGVFLDIVGINDGTAINAGDSPLIYGGATLFRHDSEKNLKFF